jgi:hypothetical protein
MSKRKNEETTTPSKKKKPESMFSEEDLILKEVNANVKKNKRDCMSKDPLLNVEWNPAGLLDRFQANNTHTRAAIVNILNQFGTQLNIHSDIQSENIWRFGTPQDLTNALLQVTTQLPWTEHVNGHPDMANVFMTLAEGKNHFIDFC